MHPTTNHTQLQTAISNAFAQICDSLQQITPVQYTYASTVLFNASIGQHVRHIIELFIELEKGYETGTINYENRKRDYRIETDKNLASDLLVQLCHRIQKPNKSLLLQAAYDAADAGAIVLTTNYWREVAYNLEHTVHHMALIRIGINEVAAITLPNSFGVAAATIKYRNTCAQ